MNAEMKIKGLEEGGRAGIWTQLYVSLESLPVLRIKFLQAPEFTHI